MTRETKIGLLVGLAFIIVVGILLSDANRYQEPMAALTGVSANVRDGVGTPHNGSVADAVVPPPAPPVTPRNTVRTRDELKPETRVELYPGGAQQQQPPVRSTRPEHGRELANNTPRDNEAVTPRNDAGAQTSRDNGGVPSDLQGEARQQGLEIEPVGGNTRAGNDTAKPAPPTNNAGQGAPSVAKGYVAQEGDTLSKLAGRFMGGNTKTNRDAIVAANPSLKNNPNNVIVGRTYSIPAAAAAKPAAPAAVAVNTPPATPPAVAAKPPVVSTGQPGYWYTVKDNDNLWKIAAEQLGDGNAYAAIKELNKEVLKGNDNVHPKMRLRLPAKPLASAN